jgi:uncharacterized spore protein YtfJ
MNTSELQQVISDARDIVTARRVYGDPYEKNGLTVIPAASVRGGAGGGTGQHGDEDSGGGGGFGVLARPVGAWVIRGDEAKWEPAVDVTRIVLGGQIVALTALLVVGRVLGRSERRHRFAVHVPQMPTQMRMPMRRRSRGRRAEMTARLRDALPSH